MTNQADNVSDWLGRTVDPRVTEVLARISEAFAVLVAAQVIVTVQEAQDFLDKPWRWAGELQCWYDAGKPWPQDPGWELFTRRLERILEDKTTGP